MPAAEAAFVGGLLDRLAGAVTAADLEVATRPPHDTGVKRSLDAGSLRVDLRLLPGALPLARLELDPPVPARELCRAWSIERPVAVSPDVEQRTWQVLAAGDDLADPYSRRIASEPITSGRWDVVAYLAARPAGDLPGVVSGASPAYDVNERGGAVRRIEIAPTAHMTRTLEPGHEDVQALLGVMASTHPVWRGSGAGWSVDAGATFVAIYDAGAPVAGGALVDGDQGESRASQLCVVPLRRGRYIGAALLDALEAAARHRGADRLRLDSSAFLLGDELPYARYGYVVGPPYAGDADVAVWAQKALRPASTPPCAGT